MLFFQDNPRIMHTFSTKVKLSIDETWRYVNCICYVYKLCYVYLAAPLQLHSEMETIGDNVSSMTSTAYSLVKRSEGWCGQ